MIRLPSEFRCVSGQILTVLVVAMNVGDEMSAQDAIVPLSSGGNPSAPKDLLQ